MTPHPLLLLALGLLGLTQAIDPYEDVRRICSLRCQTLPPSKVASPTLLCWVRTNHKRHGMAVLQTWGQLFGCGNILILTGVIDFSGATRWCCTQRQNATIRTPLPSKLRTPCHLKTLSCNASSSFCLSDTFMSQLMPNSFDFRSVPDSRLSADSLCGTLPTA